jgi:hypothetical protein
MIKEWRSNSRGMQQELGSGRIVPLSNFQARIRARHIHLDDVTDYILETKFKGVRRQTNVSISEFESLEWIETHLGPKAQVYPGKSEAFLEAVRQQGYLSYLPYNSGDMRAKRVYRCVSTNLWWYQASYWEQDESGHVRSTALDWQTFTYEGLRDFVKNTFGKEFKMSREDAEQVVPTCATTTDGPMCCDQKLMAELAA